MVLESFIYTHAGGREENQDAVGRTEQSSSGIYVVADGLGGHRLGNLASELTVSSLLQSWDRAETWTGDSFLSAIDQANAAILDLQREKHCSAKSTVAALSLRKNEAVWANVGDSRIYCVYRGRLAALTEDHSVAFKKYKTGEITKAEIATDEDQSSLLRALGNEARWKPDINGTDRIRAGASFLLCSDGFWEFVSDDEILQDCVAAQTAEEWARKLLERAGARFTPDHDNLSVITVRIK